MKTFNFEEKKQIADLLLNYCKRYASQNRAAESLKSVSPATVSAILNGKYESISDEMWRNIASQVGGDTDGWQVVETNSLSDLLFAMNEAKEWTNTTWCVGASGCGKSTAAKTFVQNNKNAFLILCSEDMHKVDFVKAMAQQVGVPTNGYSIREMLDMIITQLSNMNEPLLMFDEGDKLTENVFSYFISLYNRLEDKAGMIFLSTSYIQQRMANGLKYNKKGYQEINSRIGRKFFNVNTNNANDIHAICLANGITDKQDIANVIKEVEHYEFDLRRAKKVIAKTKSRKAKKQ